MSVGTSPGRKRVPRMPRLGLDVCEPHARWRVRDADEVLARRALNLPAGKLGFTLERLIAVGTEEFEFVHVHGTTHISAFGDGKVCQKFFHTFCR